MQGAVEFAGLLHIEIRTDKVVRPLLLGLLLMYTRVDQIAR